MRILVIDDDLGKISLDDRGTASDSSAPSNIVTQLGSLARRWHSAGKPVQLILSSSPQFEREHIQTLPRSDVLSSATHNKIGQFVREVDVVILDLGMEQGLAKPLTAERIESNFIDHDLRPPSLSERDLELLNWQLSGAGFFHLYLRELRDCQAVFFLTVHDTPPVTQPPARGGVVESSPAEFRNLVERVIDPFCHARSNRPVIAKYAKESATRVIDRLETLGKTFHRGSCLFDNLADIELAAHNSLPVILVGESGTGKETIARSIHARWAQERIRAGKADGELEKRFASVNCANLMPSTAVTQLFGAVRGAYTDSVDHSLGLILGPGCGLALKGAADPKLEPSCDFVQRAGLSPYPFLGNTAWIPKARRTGGPANDEPLGTLFLDEIAEMPESVQTQFLRYLQEWEVTPLNFPGVITGARLRVIAATSDPRFASFAGFTGERGLVGQWRTQSTQERPVRNDFMLRLDAHHIRVEPVTVDNIEDITRRLIQKRGQRQLWSEEGITALIEQLRTALQDVHEAQRAVDAGHTLSNPPHFGQKREIVNTIARLESAKATQYQRGERAHPPTIGRADVEYNYHRSPMPLRPQSPPVEASPLSGLVVSMRQIIREAYAQQQGRVPVEPWHPEAILAMFQGLPQDSPAVQTLLRLFELEDCAGPKGQRRLIPDPCKRALLLALGYPDDVNLEKVYKKIVDLVRNKFKIAAAAKA